MSRIPLTSSVILSGAAEWRGVEGIKGAVIHRTSLPDWNERVNDILAEGDRVAIRITSAGTNRGELAGMALTEET